MNNNNDTNKRVYAHTKSKTFTHTHMHAHTRRVSRNRVIVGIKKKLAQNSVHSIHPLKSVYVIIGCGETIKYTQLEKINKPSRS